ncbi:MAG TPA: SigE family RNA polymerase sigma factor [Acidimicrobiia bacterium]
MEPDCEGMRLLGGMIEEHIPKAEPAFVDSFERFYRDTWQRVYRALVVSVNDSDLAREAADEAMVRAYERWRKVSRMSNPEGWVFRVGMNWATSRLRRRSLQPRKVEAVGVVQDHDVAEPKLIDAVRNLPRRHRDVVVARYLLDMSEADTALALGIPVGTVKSRLSRALTALKEVLS